jgi:hypothetical protein
VGEEKATLIAAVGDNLGLEGGTKSVGVACGPQAANRHKNRQDKIRRPYRVLPILGFMMD